MEFSGMPGLVDSDSEDGMPGLVDSSASEDEPQPETVRARLRKKTRLQPETVRVARRRSSDIKGEAIGVEGHLYRRTKKKTQTPMVVAGNGWRVGCFTKPYQ